MPWGERRKAGLATIGFLAVVSTGARGASQPVSPGEPRGEAPVVAACPTFHWTSVPGATGYELAVWRVAGAAEPGLLDDRVPLVLRHFPSGATGWTPSRDGCLEPDGTYAWSVRAGGPSGDPGTWGDARFFAVEPAPKVTPAQATEVLRRYAGSSDSARSRESASVTGESPTLPRASAGAPGGPGGRVAPAPRGAAPDSIVIEGEYRFRTPQRFSSWVPGNVFQTAIDGASPPYARSAHGWGTPSPSGTVSLVAPVGFPDGTTLDVLICYYYDNTPTSQDFNAISGDVRLYRRRFDGANATQIAQVSFNSALQASGDFPNSVTTFTFSAPTVDNFFYSYHLTADITTNTGGAVLRFYGCVVDYLVSAVNP